MYVLDYLKKREFHQAANAFKLEAKVPDRPVGESTWVSYCVRHGLIYLGFSLAGVDYPGGFLYEWWVVFWEIFNTRSNQSYSEAAQNYLEVSAPQAPTPHFCQAHFVARGHIPYIGDTCRFKRPSSSSSSCSYSFTSQSSSGKWCLRCCSGHRALLA